MDTRLRIGKYTTIVAETIGKNYPFGAADSREKGFKVAGEMYSLYYAGIARASADGSIYTLKNYSPAR